MSSSNRVITDYINQHNSIWDKLKNIWAVCNLGKRCLCDSSTSDITFKNPAHAKEDPNNVTLYSISGTWLRNGGTLPVANDLKDKLPKEINKITLPALDGDFTKSIEHMANELGRHIEKSGEKEVVLFGYSRGMLVAEYFALYLAKKYGIQVLGLIGVCGPGKGSSAASSFGAYFSESIKQMDPNSQLIKDLIEKRRDATFPYYLYAATDDEFVTYDSAFADFQRFYPIEVDMGNANSYDPIPATQPNLKEKHPQAKLTLIKGTHSEAIHFFKLPQLVRNDIKKIVEKRPHAMTMQK